jgi:hypothetical protein
MGEEIPKTFRGMSTDVDTGDEFTKRFHKQATDDRAGSLFNREAIAQQTRGISERVLYN